MSQTAQKTYKVPSTYTADGHKIIPDWAYTGESYYNLETGRQNKSGGRKNAVYLYINVGKDLIGESINGPYICGLQSSIDTFIQRNFRDQSEDAKRALVEEPTNTELRQMCEFSLSGLVGKGRVTRVIDGDTIEMLLYVPLNNLCRKRPSGRDKVARSPIHTKTDVSQIGFHTLVRCRLLGVDTAEKCTKLGKEAANYVEKLYATYNYRVFYRTYKFDKYGRLLVNLYRNEKMGDSDLLNSQIIRDIPHAAEKYNGGTKSDYMKNLVKKAKELSLDVDEEKGLGAAPPSSYGDNEDDNEDDSEDYDIDYSTLLGTNELD
jgi:endonuclease YncB( thermonuclease family)